MILNHWVDKALTTATRPLLRQINMLQNALTSQRIQEEKSENILKEKLGKLHCIKMTKFIIYE